jgi:hypothetical protein
MHALDADIVDCEQGVSHSYLVTSEGAAAMHQRHDSERRGIPDSHPYTYLILSALFTAASAAATV